MRNLQYHIHATVHLVHPAAILLSHLIKKHARVLKDSMANVGIHWCQTTAPRLHQLQEIVCRPWLLKTCNMFRLKENTNASHSLLFPLEKGLHKLKDHRRLTSPNPIYVFIGKIAYSSPKSLDYAAPILSVHRKNRLVSLDYTPLIESR